MDPDPHNIYSRRKEKQTTSTDLSADSEESVEFPRAGWGSSLEKMPMFMRVEMNGFVMKSGKAIANTDHHTVPTGLVKARRFLDDEYLEDIECASNSKHFFFKGKCCHSFKKSEPPHNLKICVCIVTGEVKSACCSSVAGKVGVCNHVLVFMFKMCKFTLKNRTNNLPWLVHHNYSNGTREVGQRTLHHSQLWKLKSIKLRSTNQVHDLVSNPSFMMPG